MAGRSPTAAPRALSKWFFCRGAPTSPKQGFSQRVAVPRSPSPARQSHPALNEERPWTLPWFLHRRKWTPNLTFPFSSLSFSSFPRS